MMDERQTWGSTLLKVSGAEKSSAGETTGECEMLSKRKENKWVDRICGRGRRGVCWSI